MNYEGVCFFTARDTVGASPVIMNYETIVRSVVSSRRQRYCFFAEYANLPAKGLHIPQNLTNFAPRNEV